MRIIGTGRHGAAFALTLTLIAAPEAMPVRLAISFRSASVCDVTVDGAPSATLRSSEPAGDDFVCPMPELPPRRAVDLLVTLPAGAAPTFADFPRLDWTEHNGRWTGTASLPSAPAFVRVGGPSGLLARRARWLDAAALAGTLAAILWTLAYAARRSGREASS